MSGSDLGQDSAAVEAAAAAPMLDQVLQWSAVNSGSRNLEGLATMASLLTEAFGVLPGVLERRAAHETTVIAPDGREDTLALGDNLLLTVRPEAPLQLLGGWAGISIFRGQGGLEGRQRRETGGRDTVTQVLFGYYQNFERTQVEKKILHDV